MFTISPALQGILPLLVTFVGLYQSHAAMPELRPISAQILR
jgi:hypothetical protein